MLGGGGGSLVLALETAAEALITELHSHIDEVMGAEPSIAALRTNP